MAAREPVIWVTRDEPEDGPLAAALRGCGAGVICDPLVRTVQLSDGEAIARTLTPDDWLVLTSPRAVRFVSGVVAERGVRVAVAGPASASAARARGFRVAHVSATSSAAGVWRHLADHHADARICFMRSKRAAPPGIALPGLEIVDLYDTAPRRASPDTPGRATAVTFTSGEAVHQCARQFGGIPLPAISIGPETTALLRAHGAGDIIEAAATTLAGVAEAAVGRSGERRGGGGSGG